MADWERFDPSDHYADKTIAEEHVNRYVLAAGLLSGMDVLDVACGTGYGTVLLAKQAAQVVGVDVSKAAIARASKDHLAENMRFVVGDAADLSGFRDERFDAVVSFETLEHIENYRRAVDEFKRVVRRGGMVIVSSPNHDVRRNRFTDVPNNPYHVHEFRLAELLALFDDWKVEVFAQGRSGKPGALKPMVDLFLALDVFRARRLLIQHAGFIRKFLFPSSGAEILPIADNPDPMFFVIVATHPS